MRRLFLSHRLDILRGHLVEVLGEEQVDLLTPRYILVPNSYLKQWLSIELAKNSSSGGIANYKMMTLQEGLKIFFPHSGFIEVFCALYQELKTFDGLEVSEYVKDSPAKLVELSNELTSLFIRYGLDDPSLFQEKGRLNWQQKLIQNLFVEGPLRSPFQTPSKSLPPIHCFGFDFLPESVWKAMQFQSVYLFSPCRFFWEDLCSDRDRKRLLHFFEKKGATFNQREELDSYLREAPSLLANFGKLGRKTLKILDSLDYQIVENYGPFDLPSSNLQRLQRRLLDFELEEIEKKPQDFSVQLSKVGSSQLTEVEHVRGAILQLIHEKGFQFSDIAVLAPDIQSYASMIQFVFADLPFRIFDIDVGSKSFFFQGLKQLFSFNWNREDLISLFETPSFSRARNWDEKTLEWIRDEISFEEILLQRFVYLFPDDPHRINTSFSAICCECIEVLTSLRADLDFRSKPHSLKEWVYFLNSLVKKYLKIDSTDESFWMFFEKTVQELARLHQDDVLFPFAAIETLFLRQSIDGQIKASHLHAIRFGSVKEGTFTPVRALFLMGIDEEHFPRSFVPSSLDLLWQEHPSDKDRYLFLRAIFAATDVLHVSYAHFSSDGRPMNSSYFIEELARSLDAPIQENHLRPLKTLEKKPFLPWNVIPSSSLPEGDLIIALSDLASLARHPWAFYLQKQFGIWIESKDEITFSQEKAKKLRSTFQEENVSFSPGMYGEALKVEVEDLQQEWEETLRSWNIKIETASLKISTREKKRTETGWEFPPIEIQLTDRLRVQIIGEIKTFSEKGFVHFGKDSVEGLLRAWPECLVTALLTDSSTLFCLQSDNAKELHQPQEALKSFLHYYFLSLSAPSPFLVDLADPLLRKGLSECEKKMQDKQAGKGMFFEDPVFDWVSARVKFPSTEEWLSSWKEPLQNHFAHLSSLYPTREVT